MISVDSMIAAISAIGTVGAVIVALRISQKSDKLREIQEKRLQRIHAVKILPILEVHNANLTVLSTDIFFELDDDNDEKGYHQVLQNARIWAEQYRVLPTTDSFSAESLLMLPEKASLRISYAMGILEALVIDIPKFDPANYTNFSKAAQKMATRWAHEFHSASDHLGTAIGLLRTTANIKEFSPDAEELYGFHGISNPENI